MANFTSPDGELTDVFLTDFTILDRFVGNQLWGWGYNALFQLGNGDSTNRSSPIQTSSPNTNWVSVSSGATGGGGIAAALKTDGSAYIFGQDGYGEGMTGTTPTYLLSPTIEFTNSKWKQMCAGKYISAGIKTNGSLWLSGLGGGGSLGDNTVVAKSSPVQTVAGGTNWKQVSTSGSVVGAIKTDGTLWMWGYGDNGQLGDNTNVNKSSPVQTIAGGTNWKQVSSRQNLTGAIKTDGTLWVWGYNGYGALGTGNTTSYSSPVQTVAGGTNWKQVSMGAAATISGAIKTDGTLWMWGTEPGDNTTVSKSSPVQTVAGGTNWKQLACTTTSVAAIKTDGTLWTWGGNTYGLLGTNNAVSGYSSPVQTIASGNNWKSLSEGGDSIFAITFTQS